MNEFDQTDNPAVVESELCVLSLSCFSWPALVRIAWWVWERLPEPRAVAPASPPIGVTCSCDRTTPDRVPCGIFRGNQTKKGHQLSCGLCASAADAVPDVGLMFQYASLFARRTRKEIATNLAVVLNTASRIARGRQISLRRLATVADLRRSAKICANPI